MNWFTQRVGQALFTAFAAITVAFFLTHKLPGGPIDHLRAQLRSQNQQADPARLNAMMEVYTNINPDQPLYVQYTDYVISVLQGDLGQSIFYDRSVMDVLANALPWTLFVMGTGLLFTFVIGISLGTVQAYYEGSRMDKIATAGFVGLNSVPYYIAGIIFIYLFGYILGWFPVNGRISSAITPETPIEFILSALYHGILPIMSVVVTGIGGWSVTMRGNSISILGENYMRVGRLRGLPRSRLTLEYIGRNAVLPLYTSLMIAIGFIFGGSVILERIFVYPGVGYYMVEAINTRDYQLMMGAFLIITLAVVVGIFIADLTYGLIDPRIQTEENA
jgi:peptide/nickel transport system permease protein